MDTLTKKQRSQRMALVRSKNTKPEIAVNAIVRRAKLPFRHCDKSVPGSPDFTFPALKKAIFVHGCFWHRHAVCSGQRIPKTRKDFWFKKLEGNRKRDFRNQRRLNRRGWSYMVVWECQLKSPKKVEQRINRFVGKNREIN